MFPQTFDFRLFRLLHGDFPPNQSLIIARIPVFVQRKLGWICSSVHFSLKDAQKVRFHREHGMDYLQAYNIIPTITEGDFYQNPRRGNELTLEVVLHNPAVEKDCHFLVLQRDVADSGIFIRTFYRNKAMTRSKLRGSTCILNQSGLSYFKDVS